jgi:predicted dehydrogenase
MAGLTSTLKIAVVGWGRIVENNHLPVLAQMPKVSIAWVVDADSKRAKGIARKLKAGWSDDVAAIPDDLDGALIAVPNYLHAGICKAILERRMDILCEKPMVISTAECENIVKYLGRSDQILAVVHQLRFVPAVFELKRVLAEHRLGKVTRVDIALGWKFAWRSRTSFYDSPEYAGGGALMDLGCHLLDLAMWLFGDIRRAAMTALYDGTKRMDRAATVNVSFNSGLQGTIRFSRLGVLDNAVTIAGTNGWIRASLVDCFMALNISDSALCSDGRGAQLVLQGPDPFLELWSRFVASVERRALDKELAGVRQAEQVARITEGLYEEGRWETA